MNVRLCSTVSILCILFAQGRTTNHALESCLRELDADLLGMGGFNLGGTMDAAVGAGRSWWGEWSMQHQVQRPQACPPLGAAILSATTYHNDRPLGSPEPYPSRSEETGSRPSTSGQRLHRCCCSR